MHRSKIDGEFGRRWHRVAIGLGSNIGNREEYLVQAAAGIARHLSIPRISLPVESKPENCPAGSNNFLNAAMVGLSRHPPEDLLATFKAIEQAAGRELALRNAPRVIDCDLLLYGRVTSDQPELVLPHPRLEQRWFWLLPLHSLCPDADFSTWARNTETSSPPVDQSPGWQCWSQPSSKALAQAGIKLVSDLDLDC